MKNTFIKLLVTLLLIISISAKSQDYSKNKVVPLTAVVSNSPPSITLNWTENTSRGNYYIIKRKVKGKNVWNSTTVTLNTGNTTFTDYRAVVGVSYEYTVEKTDDEAGNFVNSWGYINAGIEYQLDYNKGDMLLLIDADVSEAISTKVNELKNDLYKDGWMVTTVNVKSSLSAIEVKEIIKSKYATLPNLKSLYILGHVAVPYSGNIMPDSHIDHFGAWVADSYYADLDGVWTDNAVNNTMARGTINDNVPGDGKFDQSYIPSKLELEVCRVDFSKLTSFKLTESELIQKYLTKAHEFKVGNYVPKEQGLYDNEFPTLDEGLAQNAIRNFTPFFGEENLKEIGYFQSLTSDSYLWSYGCGGGSDSAAAFLNYNATAGIDVVLLTSDIVKTEAEAVFTMLFGSYFGDWNKYNNLMRAMLANGKTLSVAWAGRPNMHYHTMALGENLGYSAKMSMDKDSGYRNTYHGKEQTHVSQLGDPSLRAYYVKPASDLSITVNTNSTDIYWTASNDKTINGYNVYRKTTNSLWSKLTTNIVTTTNYKDENVNSEYEYEYMVKAVKLKTNSSGSFYNESLGSILENNLSVTENKLMKINISPIPVNNTLNISSEYIITKTIVKSTTGATVLSKKTHSKVLHLNVNNLNSGVYLLIIETKKGNIIKKIIKN
ncbi:MAG: fibronectin type III domain-containing protein [Ichthyobacteriaceae bacterium]|nr:fibronectin type III domain-containing protein [Ichthyobacteriaceae bacterium]